MKGTKYIYASLISLSLLGIGACSKDSLQGFTEKPMVYVYKGTLFAEQATKDSTTYSFATKLEEVTYDTVKVPIRIMGTISDKDRVVNYEVATSSTADPASYELLPASIKANAYKGVLPILVKKTPSLQTKESRLWVKITDSPDFETGVDNQLTYLIKINNFLSKPPSWSDYYLGKYSQVKFGLIIRETGYTDFSGIGTSAFRYVSQTCKNWLLAYEAMHGPLLDENTDPVTFP